CASRPGYGLAKAFHKSLSCLSSELDALPRAAQPVERRRCALAPACNRSEIVLCVPPLSEELQEFGLDRPSLGSSLVPAAAGLPEPLLQLGEIESRDACSDSGDLGSQLLGALSGARLERERTQASRHLALEIASAFDVTGDPSELQLGAVT